MPSNRELQFERLWNLHGPAGGEYEREYKFHPARRWRIDFAWPAYRVGVEIEGGTFGGKSRHTTAVGHHKDCEKYNAATLLGWRILKYTAKDLQERPIQIVEEIVDLIQMSR